ncbi:MAG: PH domain-containing protein [Duncaniella sp.]|nr:PH domain-containing protein [Duncaniella sp.]
MFIDTIPYADIESVKLDAPAPDARSTFGVSGNLGYWGTWHDSEHGTYTACYGRPDQCFFVRLKDGRGYMLGCNNTAEIVDRLNAILAEKYSH